MTNGNQCVRDRLWLWGHDAGAHNPGSGPIEWNLPGPSRITPLEAAAYLNIPNMLLVRYNGTPAMPFDQLALSLRPLNRVLWSITGAMGEQSSDEREHVLALAARESNITGLVMDDFLNWDTGEPELSVAELREIGERRTLPERTLDLHMVLYSHQLNANLAEHLAHCNQASFWVWESSHLAQLENEFQTFEHITPTHARFLGCYVWDFGARAPMPLARLQHQCELGLRWLQSGRIAGLIFLPSCHCDLELETVEWLRTWIAAVGDERVIDAAPLS